jgi:hypothetical protein
MFPQNLVEGQHCGKIFLDIHLELHVFKREVIDSIFYVIVFFLFFLRGILCEISIFPGGGFFSPSLLELLLVTFLVGWVVGEFLQDVVFLGKQLETKNSSHWDPFLSSCKNH